MAQSVLIQQPDGKFVFSKADNVTKAQKGIITDHSAIHEGEGFSSYAIVPSVAHDDNHYISFTTGTNKYIHFKSLEVWNGDGKMDVTLIEAPEAITGGTTRPVVNRNRAFPRLSEVGVKDGVTLTTLSTARTISALSKANKTFSTVANVGTTVKPFDIIQVAGSTGNDGLYTVESVTAGATSVVKVYEAIPDATADGTFTVQRVIDGFRKGGPQTNDGPGNSSNPGDAGSVSLDIEFVLKRNTTYLISLDNKNSGTLAQDASVWLYWYEEVAGK